MQDGPQTLRGPLEHGIPEGNQQGKANLGSPITGKLLVVLGNSYNLFKPQFPPLLWQVIAPTSWDYGKGDARCRMWKHVECLKSLFIYRFSFQQADVTAPLMSQVTSMGSCCHCHQQPLPPALRRMWHKIVHRRFYHLPPAKQPTGQSHGQLGKPDVASY